MFIKLKDQFKFDVEYFSYIIKVIEIDYYKDPYKSYLIDYYIEGYEDLTMIDYVDVDFFERNKERIIRL